MVSPNNCCFGSIFGVHMTGVWIQSKGFTLYICCSKMLLPQCLSILSTFSSFVYLIVLFSWEKKREWKGLLFVSCRFLILSPLLFIIHKTDICRVLYNILLSSYDFYKSILWKESVIFFILSPRTSFSFK